MDKFKNFTIRVLVGAILCGIITVKSFAHDHTIAAVVNEDIITEQEVHDRKKIVAALGGYHNLGSAESAQLKAMTLHALIDEKLIEQQAIKLDVSTTPEEVKNAVKIIEKSNNLPEDYFIHMIRKHNQNYASFVKKVETDVLKEKISNQILARGVNITNNEIKDAVATSHTKDITVNFLEYYTEDNSDKSYADLTKLRKFIKDCHKDAKIPSHVSFKRSISKLSELDSDVSKLLADLPNSNFSAIIERNGKLYTFQVCEKKVVGMSEKESDFLANFLGRKKVSQKFLHFMDSIKKQAFIKLNN